MRVSPFRVNAHQVSEKRDAAHNQAARGELYVCHIGPKPHTTVLSKSVGRAFALS